MISKFWDWLVKSSADPQQVALTAKGLITSILPLLMLISHNPNINTLPDTIYTFIVGALGIISGMMFLFGISRKILLTFKTN